MLKLIFQKKSYSIFIGNGQNRFYVISYRRQKEKKNPWRILLKRVRNEKLYRVFQFKKNTILGNKSLS